MRKNIGLILFGLVWLVFLVCSIAFLIGYNTGYTKGERGIDSDNPVLPQSYESVQRRESKEALHNCMNYVVKVLASGSRHNSSSSDVVQFGSGVVVASDSNCTKVVTSLHVITRDDIPLSPIKVECDSGTFVARLLKVDYSNDLAVLAIYCPVQKACVVGDDAILGDDTLTVGYKAGQSKMLTKGAVAAHKIDERTNQNMLLTTNKIASGFSGGGLFDSCGRLVGIIKAKEAWDDLDSNNTTAYCVPVSKVVELMRD